MRNEKFGKVTQFNNPRSINEYAHEKLPWGGSPPPPGRE